MVSVPSAAWARTDRGLWPHWPVILRRHALFEEAVRTIERTEGSLHAFCFANGIHRLGLQRARGGWLHREWAPAALAVSLVGDFNGWDASAHPCARDGDGVFEVFVREPALRVGSRYKLALRVRAADGGEELVMRMPAWARCTQQDRETGEFCALVPADLLAFAWRHPRPPPRAAPRVYEAHVGISSAEPTIAGWTHFRQRVLPRLVRLGYDALLLIGVLEHGFYGSFGYQVTSFFAPSSRFGSPHELQQLVDAAHGYGLLVLFELVHSHASANTREGLSALDYFAEGELGWHAEWGTRMFDYTRLEVLRFLLSQVAWFAEAYRVDGFRFDAVSAAIYQHRSLGGRGKFDSGYAEYFGEGADVDVAALVYFQLVNHMTHELVRPPLLTIAEEHSGLPGLCAAVSELGVGFDFRQAMGVPPLWERLLSAPPSARMGMAELVTVHCRRRDEERRLAYCECHDQSFVGGKSLAFRLMGASMYEHMSCIGAAPPEVERGMALHAMSRLLTLSLGGEAYLNFIGNEFGHPEWIDFPREGNGHSMHMARRRWDLADNPLLRYSQLQAFDASMHALQAERQWLRAPAPRGLAEGDCWCCEQRQSIWFGRGGLLFVFNFHPLDAATVVAPLCDGDAALAPPRRLLESDDPRFGGRDRPTEAASSRERGGASARVCVPALACCVLCCGRAVVGAGAVE